MQEPLKPISKDADSRLKGYFGSVSFSNGLYERVYCFLCGRPSGWISKESSTLIAPERLVATCDDCDMAIIAKYGNLPFDKIPTHLYDAMGYMPEIGE